MTSRFRSIMVVVALMGATLAVQSGAPAGATFPGQNGLLLYGSGVTNHLIYTACPDGSGARVVGAGATPSASPDGTKIAYHGLSGLDTQGIWIMDADGSNPVRVTDGGPGVNDRAPVWSPDGNTLAAFRWVSWGEPHQGNIQPVLINVHNGNVTELLSDSAIRNNGSSIAWSPNGQWIYFTAAHIPQGTSFQQGNNVYRVSSNGGSAQLLLEGMGHSFYTSLLIHPEGTHFTVTRQSPLLDFGDDPSISMLDQLSVQMTGGEEVLWRSGQAVNADSVRTITAFSPDSTRTVLYRFERGQNPQRFVEITDPSFQAQHTAVLPGYITSLSWTTIPANGCSSGPGTPTDPHIGVQVEEVMLAAGGNLAAQYVELSDPVGGAGLAENGPYRLRVHSRTGSVIGTHTIPTAALAVLADGGDLLVGTAAADAVLGSTRDDTMSVALPAVGQVCVTAGPDNTVVGCVTWGCDVTPVTSPQTVAVAYPTSALSTQRQGSTTTAFRLAPPTPGSTNLIGLWASTCPVDPLDRSELTDTNRGDVSAPDEVEAGSDIEVQVGTAHAGQPVSTWMYSTPTDLGWSEVDTDGAATVTIPADVPAGAHRIAVYGEDHALIGWDDITVLAAAGVARLSGPNRVATAAQISRASFLRADTVVLATARGFPDALAGGPLAARLDAPILLTSPAGLDPETAAELARLQPSTLVVLGGAGALPQDVVDAAAEAAGGAEVDRIGGANRYATAADIAARWPDADRAYLATGVNFPDALAGAALAAARNDGPVLLTPATALPDTVAAQLARLQPGELVVLGGASVVPDTVVDEAAARSGGATRTRLGGTDRYVTASLIAERFPAPADVVYVATGQNFPDALAGTPAAAMTGSPVLLTRAGDLPASTVDALSRLQPRRIVILGGTAAVSADLESQLQGHLRD